MRFAPISHAYDKGGRLTYKGPLPGGSSPALSYAYAPVGLGGLPDHAPESVTYNGTPMAFAYDANGNMGTGLHGKTMAYDAENRPLSVTHQGAATCYLYGADGGRLMKVEGLPQGSDCTALPAEAARTAYVGPLEIRSLGQAGQVVMAYPAGAVRLTAANDAWEPAFLHKDHLGSVRAISGPDGTPEERTLYRPYGAQSEVVTATLSDDKSWLGERYDAGAGLQYLNARYYDPELAMFLQPDWFDPNTPGVGTNRYSYSFGDPVNKMDPGGNEIIKDDDFADKDREQLKRDFEALRTKLETQIRNAREIARRIREGDTSPMTHSESATYLEMIKNAGGGNNVTESYASRAASDAQTMLTRTGEPGEGVHVVPGGAYKDGGGGTAYAVHNSRKITVYDSYFLLENGRKRDTSNAYILAHEMGHEALGKSDNLPDKALPYTEKYPSDVVLYNKQLMGYRAAGAAIARAYNVRKHNDRFICMLGFRC